MKQPGDARGALPFAKHLDLAGSRLLTCSLVSAHVRPRGVPGNGQRCRHTLFATLTFSRSTLPSPHLGSGRQSRRSSRVIMHGQQPSQLSVKDVPAYATLGDLPRSAWSKLPLTTISSASERR